MRITLVAAIAALALPTGAAAQSVIAAGQTVRGQISSSDPLLEDDTHYRCHRLQTRPGASYVVEMRSGDFDAYLAVGQGSDCGDMDVEDSDDDGAGGSDSRLEFTGDGSVWLLRANTLASGETGAYSLSVVIAAPANAPRAGSAGRLLTLGETVRAELSEDDAKATDDSFYDCYRFSRDEASGGAITMKADFDAYLSLHQGASCEGALVESNDDDAEAGGTNARIGLSGIAPGQYSIRANSLIGETTGPYSLSFGPTAPQATSRWADFTVESQACLFRPGSRAMTTGVGKRDMEGYVLLVDGRETLIEDEGYSEAGGRAWFTASQPVRIGGRSFAKYGLPRVLGANEVEYFAEYDGALFAAEPGQTAPEVVYALVRSVGCEFQPYQLEE